MHIETLQLGLPLEVDMLTHIPRYISEKALVLMLKKQYSVDIRFSAKHLYKVKFSFSKPKCVCVCVCMQIFNAVIQGSQSFSACGQIWNSDTHGGQKSKMITAEGGARHSVQ
uniref:Uncharacterized protein n=1 Tax=Sphaerodactylus townsendi TaxID=933632 RepID=A0ACB8F4H1_9SAUR